MTQTLKIEKTTPIPLTLDAHIIGQDICVIVYGGTMPHIGAVTLSIPRKSGADFTKFGANTSVLSILGHKEDNLFRALSNLIARKTGRTVVVTGGIHIDNGNMELITAICKSVAEMGEDFADLVNRGAYK